MPRWPLLMLVAALLILGGCDRDPSIGPSGNGRSDPITIAYIPGRADDAYYDAVIEGFKKAAAENGADFVVAAPATADVAGQLAAIREQVSRRVSVLAISPNSPDALNASLKEAMDKGITVITVDADVAGGEQYRHAGVLTVDPETIGESQLELLGMLMSYQGKFAILSTTTDAAKLNRWIDAMKRNMLANPKFKMMELVGVVYGNDDPAKSLAETESLLEKHPDLRGIAAPTPVGLTAAAQCIQARSKAGAVAVTGLGKPNQMRSFIKDGTVKAFALWNPFNEGYLTCHLAAQMAKRTVRPATGVQFVAGTLGDRAFEENGIVITGGPTTFTKDNIDQYRF